MIEKTIYMPYNGNIIFYDKKDCLVYEWETSLLPAIKDSVVFYKFDDTGLATKYELTDESNYVDFYTAYINADIIEICKPIEPEISMAIKDSFTHYNIEIPTEVGTYEYEYEWIGDDCVCHWYKLDYTIMPTDSQKI